MSNHSNNNNGNGTRYNECVAWNTSSSCRFGDACRFLHHGGYTPSTPQPTPTPTPPTVPAAAKTAASTTAIASVSSVSLSTSVGGAASNNNGGNGIVCRDWSSSGTCKFGDRCHFRHIYDGNNSHGTTITITPHDSAPSSSQSSQLCREWAANGTCRFGSACRYLHTSPSTISNSNNAATRSRSRSPGSSRSTDTPNGNTSASSSSTASTTTASSHGHAGGGHHARVASKSYRAAPGGVVPCREWALHGTCPWGQKCKYSHGANDSKEPMPSLPYAIGGTALTADGRYYIRGGQMSDEDRIAEFKQIGESKIPEQRIAEHANKYIVAFLNSDSGGILYCGIRDDGVVTGIPLNREQRDTVRLNVDAYVARMQPVPSRELYVFDFIPIVMRASPTVPIPDLFVVKFTIQSGWASSPVYATGDMSGEASVAWRRYDASVRPMKVIEIAERAKRHATSGIDVQRVVDRVISSQQQQHHRDTTTATGTTRVMDDKPDAAPLPSSVIPIAIATPLASTPAAITAVATRTNGSASVIHEEKPSTGAGAATPSPRNASVIPPQPYEY